MKKLFATAFFVIGLGRLAYAGPPSPPAGVPILNQHQRQIGAELNVATMTADSVALSTFTNVPSLPLGLTIGGATYNSLNGALNDGSLSLASGTITNFNTSNLTAANENVARSTITNVMIKDGIATLSSETVTNLTATNATVATLNASSATATILNTTSATIHAINSVGVWGFRNRVVNGDFRWDQRNEGSAISISPSGNVYGPDCFFGTSRGYPGKFTMQRKQDDPPHEFSYYLRVTVSSATLYQASSETANSEYVLSTRIEGPNWSDSAWSQSDAKPVTMSFWVRSSSAGYFGMTLESSSSNPDTYPTHYRIPTANVWTKIIATFPGDTGGTNWNFLPGQIGCKIIFDFGSGSAFEKTTPAWYGGLSQEYNHLTGDNKIIKTLGVTWDIAGLQLEMGPQATEFEFVPYQVSKRNVQRYYEKTYPEGTVPGAVTSSGIFQVVTSSIGAPHQLSGIVNFITEKALVPTVTVYPAGATPGQMRWVAPDGTITNRATNVNDVSLHGFDVDQSSSYDPLAYGQYTAEGNL